ncbi:hypothetical protein [Streptomyces fradiae]|uniref:hypothetical protein n=1 Tax=Streptomyces fradiae TaxID=1906 RepID=UPI0029439C8D|nr:hypothetical protein [Streptomyces fradiae]WOI61925.1 hypothetical protein RYQ63_19585 [Streptomyces fradiae]
MADSYRYRCGECGHRTAWGGESRGAAAIEAHYHRSHPEVVPGGVVEFRRGSSCGGSGCLIVLAVVVVLLVLASRS